MISMRVINSNGGAMELACADTHGVEIIDVIEPSLQSVETAKANFPSLNIRHGYIGTELASEQAPVDVCYVNVAKRTYTAKESAVPIIDKNMAGSCGNGVLVMKNAFRLISLQEPEMFIAETGLKIHTAASEAFAAIPGYYIRQIVLRDAPSCGYPMKKQKSFLVGTKRDFDIRWNKKPVSSLRPFLEKGVDYGELPAYAVNRMNGLTKGFPSVIIDPRTDNIVPNITGHYAKDDSAVLVRDEGSGTLRPFTEKEIARFYGFPDEYKWYGGKRQVIRQITDSVGVGFADFLVRDVIRHYFEDCYSRGTA